MRQRAALLTIALSILAGCDSHAYYEEAKLYVFEAQQVLRDARVCVSCTDVIKFEAGAWKLGPVNYGGVSINVYQVGDRALAGKIAERFREKQKSMPHVPVNLRIYASKHGEPKRLTLEQKMG